MFNHLQGLTTTEGHWIDTPEYKPYKLLMEDLDDTYRLKNILELGFNIGHSATMWLEYTNANLLSVDNCHHKYTREAAIRVGDKYGDRFNFLRYDTRDPNLLEILAYRYMDHFDLAFIDAGHDVDCVTNDINICLDIGIEVFLFDDYHLTVKSVVDRFVDVGVLNLIKLYDSHYPHKVALCERVLRANK